MPSLVASEVTLPLRRVLVSVLDEHPNSALTHIRGVSGSLALFHPPKDWNLHDPGPSTSRSGQPADRPATPSLNQRLRLRLRVKVKLRVRLKVRYRGHCRVRCRSQEDNREVREVGPASWRRDPVDRGAGGTPAGTRPGRRWTSPQRRAGEQGEPLSTSRLARRR
jgi:hypothetical protein